MNTDFDLQECTKAFNEKQHVLIKDFMDSDHCKQIHGKIKEIAPDKWFYNFASSSTKNRDRVRIEHSDKNKVFIQLLKKYAKVEYKKGEFSYSFQNIIGKDALEINATFELFESIFRSSDFKALIEKVCGLEVEKIEDWFISKYIQGDFLSRHTDGPRGKLGFVYYLSKNWQASWGGEIVFTTKDKEVITSYSPLYNELLLFSVKNKPPVFHEVKPIVADEERIAIYGWLQ